MCKNSRQNLYQKAEAIQLATNVSICTWPNAYQAIQPLPIASFHLSLLCKFGCISSRSANSALISSLTICISNSKLL